MTWDELRHNDRREQEQLDVARALIEDATRDSALWLQADPSAEERVHVVALQARLADLDRIVARRMERRVSPRDSWEWSEAARDVLSLLEKAKQVRGNIVGKGLARLVDHLPKELPGRKPKLKLPAPVRTVSTALTSVSVTAPKASQVPHDPPMYFPSDLWPQTNVILLESQRKFPLQTQTLELCRHVTAEMTPVFCEAVRGGKIKASSVLQDGCGGIADLLHSLLVYNDDEPHSGFVSLSDKACRLREEVRKSDEWLALARAIAELQQRRANENKPALSAAPKMQSTGIIPGQFAGIPHWQLTEQVHRGREAVGRTDGKQTAQFPDPILDAFNRRDTEAAIERTSAQNNGKTTHNEECQRSNRAIVKAYIEEVRSKRNKRITKKNIWMAAGYKTRTEFERWEREDPKHPNKAADEAFTRVLCHEKPHLK